LNSQNTQTEKGKIVVQTNTSGNFQDCGLTYWFHQFKNTHSSILKHHLQNNLPGEKEKKQPAFFISSQSKQNICIAFVANKNLTIYSIDIPEIEFTGQKLNESFDCQNETAIITIQNFKYHEKFFLEHSWLVAFLPKPKKQLKDKDIVPVILIPKQPYDGLFKQIHQVSEKTLEIFSKTQAFQNLVQKAASTLDIPEQNLRIRWNTRVFNCLKNDKIQTDKQAKATEQV
jgi:hypothetical protein